jgi:integrase
MEDIQRMMDALDDKKLSRGTIKLCLVLTQAALQLAMDMDIVLKNVAKNGLLVVPVNAPVGTKEPWSIEEAKVFLGSLSPDKDDLDLCFLLMALTGIRRGEAAGLRWGDIDLDDALLHVRRSVQSVNGVMHVSEGGKTANARRTVGLVDRVSELLARHKMREAERFWANGLIFGDDSAVFAGWLCKPRSPHTISTRFQAAVKRSGVRPVALHSLRHFANTQAQFDPTVSATMLRMVMGHGSAIMTKAYTHADAEAAHLVAGSIADRLYG